MEKEVFGGNMKVEKIENKVRKKEVCLKILRDLPEWFGIESSLLNYSEEVMEKEFYTATISDEPVAFISVKINNEFTAEIYVIGILKNFHRMGIGKILLEKAEEILKEKGYKFLMVKTVSESLDNAAYAKTRLFYKKIGFLPLEEIAEIWGEQNPCLILIKIL